MTTCEVCGSACAESAAYCSACGHQLGRPPGEPPGEPAVVNVRVVNSFWDGCVGCFSWAVGVVAILALVGWIFSC